MSIFLLILKIIGIVLLSIIGLVLFLLLLALFVPIRYKVTADYDEKLLAEVRVSYLLHIVSFLLRFNGEALDNTLRICGIKLSGKEKRKKQNKNNNKKTDSDEEAENNVEYTLEGFDEDDFKIEDPQTETYYYSSMDEQEETEGFFAKLKEYLSFVFDFIKNIKDKTCNFITKLKKIKDNIVYYIDLISSEHTKKTLKYALDIILKILKAIKPRKFKGSVRFGFEDPETCGKVLSILAILYPFIENVISITPEFDEQILQGNLFMKGRIFIITLLIQGWKLYFNKDIRKVVKEFQREK